MVERAPDFQSTRWKAWSVPLPPPEKPDHTAGLGMWLLHCPGAHAFWSYWWMGLIHLRPIEGVRPAIILTPGAQWEITCFAQDPDKEPNPDDTTTIKMLTPIDWAVQFGDVKNDRQAMEVAEMAVKAIVRGTVSPDSDFRSFWEKSIPSTAACVAMGKHTS